MDPYLQAAGCTKVGNLTCWESVQELDTEGDAMQPLGAVGLQRQPDKGKSETPCIYVCTGIYTYTYIYICI